MSELIQIPFVWVVTYPGADFRAVSDGGEPLLAGRDDVEGGDVVPDGEEARIVRSEVRCQEDLESRAVDDVAVQPRVVVVHLRNPSLSLKVRTYRYVKRVEG